MFKKILTKGLLNILVVWIRITTYFETRGVGEELTDDQLIIKHAKFHKNGNISFDQDDIKRINKWI